MDFERVLFEFRVINETLQVVGQIADQHLLSHRQTLGLVRLGLQAPDLLLVLRLLFPHQLLELGIYSQALP